MRQVGTPFQKCYLKRYDSDHFYGTPLPSEGIGYSGFLNINGIGKTFLLSFVTDARRDTVFVEIF